MGRKSKTTKAWWPAVRRYLTDRRNMGLPPVTTATIISETYMIGSKGNSSAKSATATKRLCQSRMCPTKHELTKWLNNRPSIIAVKGRQRDDIAWVINNED